MPSTFSRIVRCSPETPPRSPPPFPLSLYSPFPQCSPLLCILQLARPSSVSLCFLGCLTDCKLSCHAGSCAHLPQDRLNDKVETLQTSVKTMKEDSEALDKKITMRMQEIIESLPPSNHRRSGSTSPTVILSSFPIPNNPSARKKERGRGTKQEDRPTFLQSSSDIVLKRSEADVRVLEVQTFLDTTRAILFHVVLFAFLLPSLVPSCSPLSCAFFLSLFIFLHFSIFPLPCPPCRSLTPTPEPSHDRTRFMDASHLSEFRPGGQRSL